MSGQRLRAPKKRRAAAEEVEEVNVEEEEEEEEAKRSEEAADEKDGKRWCQPMWAVGEGRRLRVGPALHLCAAFGGGAVEGKLSWYECQAMGAR